MFRATGIRIIFALLLALELSAKTLPSFQISDQYEKRYTPSIAKNKILVLMGCHLKDFEFCRKTARFVYWKMQNLLSIQKSEQVQFWFYIDLRESNKLIDAYITESKTKKFEPVLLDRKGELSEGLKEGYAFIRVLNQEGHVYHNRYVNSYDKQLVQEIYELINREI